MNENQFILDFTKSKFKTQLYIEFSEKSKKLFN